MNDNENKQEDTIETEQEEYGENVITLTSDSGEQIPFRQEAIVEWKKEFYAILQPVYPIEGMGENDALVFSITKDEDGTATFEIVSDDDVLNGVFEEYQRLYEEYSKNNPSCNGHCDGCSGCDGEDK